MFKLTNAHPEKQKSRKIILPTIRELKAQFLWPFKIDYWVIDLADDYSYMVVGNPDHKFLFIMSRKPSMDKKLHDELVEKCKEMGYPVDELTAQR